MGKHPKQYIFAVQHCSANYFYFYFFALQKNKIYLYYVTELHTISKKKRWKKRQFSSQKEVFCTVNYKVLTAKVQKTHGFLAIALQNI